MFQRLSFVAVAAALSLSSVASAEPRQNADAAGGSEAKGDPDRRVCKSVATTGTRLGKTRVCMTAREWDAKTAEDRRSLERMQGSRTEPQN